MFNCVKHTFCGEHMVDLIDLIKFSQNNLKFRFIAKSPDNPGAYTMNI